jgi:hypothetical protein
MDGAFVQIPAGTCVLRDAVVRTADKIREKFETD